MQQLSTITKIKDPNEVTDYMLDWSPILSQVTADTIATSTWTAGLIGGVTDPLITIEQSTFTPTTTLVWVAGGTAPLTSIVNKITTAGGGTYYQTIHLKIRSL